MNNDLTRGTVISLFSKTLFFHFRLPVSNVIANLGCLIGRVSQFYIFEKENDAIVLLIKRGFYFIVNA